MYAGMPFGASAKVIVPEGALAPLTVGAISPNDNELATAPTVIASRSLRPNCIIDLPPSATKVDTIILLTHHR